MNPNLHSILNFVQQAKNLTAEEKDALIKAAKDADKELTIAEFKLERTEKVKRTTSILLEETIEELEHKRKAVEAQNRKLEIEAALEKVRSRSLAMHKSDELQQVVSVVFERLRELNISMDAANINIFSEGTRDADLWIASPGQNYASCFHLPYIDYIIPASIFNAKEKGDDFFSKTFSFDEKNKYFNYLFEHSDFKHLPDDRKNKMLAGAAYTVSFAFTKNAAISIHSYSGKLFSDNENDTLKRFAKVFEQAYIRFLDLQKAEAQAREAKIEASLERVRSKAMAMQKSEDLANAVKIVFEELDKLNLGMLRCGIGILDKNKRSADVYTTTKSDNDTTVQVSGDESMDIHPLLQGAFEAWLKKQLDYSYDLKGEDLKNYYKSLSRGNFRLPDSQSLVSAPEETKQYYYNAIFPHGGLFAFRDTPFPDEAKTVMKRFADVFNLTYTRFNDLKQAEAQAREAKIEASLERVRSRTMAMQRSDELSETAFVLYQQFKELGEAPIQITIGIFNEEEGVIEFWVTDMEGNKTDNMARAALDEPTLIKKIYAAWKAQKKSTVIELAGNELQDWVNYRQGLSGIKDDQDYSNSRRSVIVAFFSKGLITLSTTEPKPKELVQLIERFAGVFDGTYTRFNDLKQAEAQARESKIQLAMERVRARTMAMQHSDELKDAAALLFQQAKALGVPAYSCGYNIWEKDDKVFTSWMSTQDGSDFNAVLNIPLTEDANFLRYAESKQKGDQFFVLELRGERMQEHYAYLKTIPAFREWFDYAVKMGFDLPETQIHYVANFSHGNLLFISLQPCPEFHDVFKRFAAVFEQTYTRFLDLQKAEAQARESQIELGLERVRARAMAMQKSDELSELVNTVFKELTKLDFALTWCIINIIDENSMSNTVWAANPDINKAPESYHMLFEDYPFHHAMMKGWKERKAKYVYTLEGTEKKIYDDYLFSETEFKRTPEAAQAASRAMEKYVVSFSFSNFGGLQTVGAAPLSDSNLDILSRFGKVFDLTYTRFNDLQKAEAQAREAKIETALEKVRSRTMAMQKSEELQSTALLLFQQVAALGVPSFACGFNIWDEDRKEATAWMAREDALQPPFKTSSSKDVFLQIYEAAQRGESLFVAEQGGKTLEDHYKYMASIPVFREVMEKMTDAGHSVPTFQIIHCAFFSQGYLMFISYEPVPEAYDIFKRFSNVFEQTYTRFLDLQKSEAQARESQIELALERVRARTMAMQKSDELKEVIRVVFEQFIHLNINIEHTGFILDYKDRDDMHIWLADQHEVPSEVTIPYFDCAHWNSFNEARKKGKDFFANHLDFEEKNKFYHDLFDLFPVPDEAKEYYFNCPCLAISTVLLENVGLYIENFSGIPYTDEENKTLMRFGKVFQQTYTRFLDLKKAEAQAREAKIETALEKVRSRTMAMQKSDELSDTAYILFQQFKELGEEPIQITIGIFNEAEGLIEFRVTDWSGGGTKVGDSFNVSIEEPTLIHKIYEAWKQQQRSLVTDLAGQELEDWIKYRNAVSNVPVRSEDTGGRRVITTAFFSKGHISFSTPAPRAVETIQLLERFAGVFDLTYTRFLDLKIMEAQAKKERIEAALERVRSSSLAMHKTDELKNVVKVVFENLRSLGLKNMDAVNINIFHKGSKDFDLWIAAPGQDYTKNFRLPYLNHPIANDFFKTVESGVTLHKKVYPYEVKNEYFEYMFENSDNKYLPGERKRLVLNGTAYSVTAAIATHSSIFVHNYNGEIFSAEDDEIILRFSQVFDQAYKRYLDLQKAELLMRDAVKQASLDRIRGQVASMRSTQDLQRITPLIWQELGKLDIPFIRCGVFIMDEEQAMMQAYLSTPHGESLGVLNLSYDYDEITTQTVAQWRRKEVFRHHWTKEEFIKWMRSMIDEGQIKNQEDFQRGMTPPESLYLHFIPFPQGMLYVGAIKPLSAYELELLTSLAEAFSVAYSRYEDFTKLEKAKHNIETTLTELKAAQSQLIQSEKMASLGELTAGIAHEIQNPLNFVNNFSEVSNELLDEMKEELAKGNNEYAITIAEDVKQNLEKINHHGKRADAIVKGMLQHSRSSSGVKEPTDMNALADEYLRLCYHGLRAKDKSFNATMKTDFDESIEKINVIPQDIGRVMLNLFTNAFYAVNEKRKLLKSESKEYEPTVSVASGKENGNLIIKIKDNGLGIPQQVLDKIFQPFFTTKPAGEGTGLGLSLSYDIIKVHGGEIKVDTKAGEGSEFVVYLPLN